MPPYRRVPSFVSVRSSWTLSICVYMCVCVCVQSFSFFLFLPALSLSTNLPNSLSFFSLFLSLSLSLSLPLTFSLTLVLRYVSLRIPERALREGRVPPGGCDPSFADRSSSFRFYIIFWFLGYYREPTSADEPAHHEEQEPRDLLI